MVLDGIEVPVDISTMPIAPVVPMVQVALQMAQGRAVCQEIQVLPQAAHIMAIALALQVLVVVLITQVVVVQEQAPTETVHQALALLVAVAVQE